MRDKPEKLLCIGGSYDAQRLPYNGRSYHVADYSGHMTRPMPRVDRDGYSWSPDQSMPSSVYHVEQIYFKSEKDEPAVHVEFYRHETLTALQAFRELLKGYRRMPFIKSKRKQE